MRSTKSIVLLGVLVLAAMIIVGRAMRGSGPVNEEQVVAALVEAMASAAEARDVKAMRAHLSRRYKDPAGRTYSDINDLLRIHYLRKGKISVYIASSEVTVDHDAEPMRATVEAKVVLTRGVAGGKLPGVLPQSGDAVTFDVVLEKEDGEWKLTSALWEGLRAPGDLLR